MKDEKIKKIIREDYAKIAKKETSCCATAPAPISHPMTTSAEIGRKIGYREEDINSVPEGANMGLGCGNPVALASLREGETALDLGSGGGFDCFLAASRVGKKEKVIGVDMTPEMIDQARKNVRKGGYKNVKFRLGEIENLPVVDSTVDVVISNCVINLSLNKACVFEEAFRVLKPDGRLMVADIVLSRKLPEAVKKNVQAYVACLSGAEMKNAYLRMIEDAGFQEVKVIEESSFAVEDMDNDPIVQAIFKTAEVSAEEIRKITDTVSRVKVSGAKPKGQQSLKRRGNLRRVR